jgi:hypothetical protein
MAQPPTNRSHAEILLSWGIESLKTYVREVLPYLETRISENTDDPDNWVRADGSLSERELLRSAYDVALYSVNERLNAIVDGMLLHVARLHEDAKPNEHMGAQNRSRAMLMHTIEQEHNIRLRFISGWNVVEKVRDDANATKHRLGTTLVYHSELGINELTTAKLTPNDAHERIQVVESWLREIIRVTEKHTI